MIMLSPEMLASDEFADSLNITAFYKCIFHLAIDECHLFLNWGKSFWKPFLQIAHVRQRLPDHVTMSAFTRTLRGGQAKLNVCKFLGLHKAPYHFIRHSNLCNDIKITYRELSSQIKGWNFPELDWVLDEKEATIISCRTVALTTRVVLYLRRRAKELGKAWDLDDSIQLYHSANWDTYNEAT
jgi:superfamily II DNA helicase RecQ